MFIVLIFLISIVTANLLTNAYGPTVAVINAFFLIGLDLTLRDRLHEQWSGKNLRVKMLGLICAGAVITYILNRGAGMICVASVTAFSVALIVDALVYQRFINKKPFLKINYSNIASAATDSILFPTIAFMQFMPVIILLMFLAKAAGGAIWSIILIRVDKRLRS